MTRQSLDLIQRAMGALAEHVAILDETGQIVAINMAWREFGNANGLGYPDHAKAAESTRPERSEKLERFYGVAASALIAELCSCPAI
jgi:hypothetical protein